MSCHCWNSGKPKRVFFPQTGGRPAYIGVYLVDVLDEAHGDTFIADAYSGSGSKQPGFIDVKTGIIRINDMFLLLQLIMHVTSGPIVLPGFTPGGFFFRFCLPPLLFGQSRPGEPVAVRMCWIQVWRVRWQCVVACQGIHLF